MKRITLSGFHPILPMTKVELGDYGCFENGMWRRMGNLTRIKGYRCTLHTIEDNYHDEAILIDHGVTLGAALNAEASCDVGELGCRLEFANSNDFYIQAELSKGIKYDSINGELKDQIERLKEAGKWDKEFHVVVNVIFVKSHFCAFAARSGGSINLKAEAKNVDPLQISSSKVRLSGDAVLNREGVEVVEIKDTDTLHPIGFQTVKYSKNWLFPGKLKYTGDGNEIESKSTDNDGENPLPQVFG